MQYFPPGLQWITGLSAAKSIEVPFHNIANSKILKPAESVNLHINFALASLKQTTITP
jgi:hypothetical protein